MLLCEKPVSLRIMILARDPNNESTREITKVTRDVSEAVPLSYELHTPTEMVTRLGWTERLVEKPQKPWHPKRQNKPVVVVEIVDDAVPQDRFGEKNVVSVQQATDVPVPHDAEVPKTSDPDNTAPQTVEQASDVPVPQNLETPTDSAIPVKVAMVIPPKPPRDSRAQQKMRNQRSTRDHSLAPSA